MVAKRFQAKLQLLFYLTMRTHLLQVFGLLKKYSKCTYLMLTQEHAPIKRLAVVFSFSLYFSPVQPVETPEKPKMNDRPKINRMMT